MNNNTTWPVIEGCRLEKELGKGGMAVVYLGKQERLERRVAVKVLNSKLLVDETFARRFLEEARIAANLIHNNIITVHDVCHVAGNYYIIMEYLPGGKMVDCPFFPCLENDRPVENLFFYAWPALTSAIALANKSEKSNKRSSH